MGNTFDDAVIAVERLWRKSEDVTRDDDSWYFKILDNPVVFVSLIIAVILVGLIAGIFFNL